MRIAGSEAYEPRILLGLLFYGYATGVFSSRQIEEKNYTAIPFYFTHLTQQAI
jgi:hypothetical protein